MTNADKPAFVAALTELKALKPGPAFTLEQFHAWWNQMRDRWELVDFQSACRKLANDMEFMPNPFHFEQLRATATKIAVGEAWAAVLHCARTGARLPNDPILQRAVAALGGIQTVAMSEVNKTHFLERRFAEHYEEMEGAYEARAALPNAGQTLQLRQDGPTNVSAVLARLSVERLNRQDGTKQ